MTTSPPTRDQLLGMYRMLVRIRAADEAIRGGIATGKLIFFYFPVAGQEAIPAALSQVLKPDDHLAVTYRGFHHQFARGVSFAGILGEMTGKATAIHGGRGGPMHICDPSKGLMMTTGIVGATVPPAVGMAWASQVQKDGKVTVAVLGDGAMNQGAVHEGMNIASTWKLPIVFICENNKFAETTPTHETFRGKLADRAVALGMAAQTVDGFDPIALFEALSAAVAKARGGGGPTLIDAECYRYYGHYFGDPMITVPKEQMAAERQKDAVVTYPARLIASHGFEAAQLDAIRQEAEAEAKAVLAANIAAPPVSADGLFEGVYANPVARRLA
ncbi:MAG TPA: thiamine pyrophosphate-dependent dehydrogenase E1 component subunit alpha [Nevskiaceae bacterium]|nr:thiamine pyrophosphate-dependent dehydrogenase E1 component subunit alpha [Nevskiaceae bacterium]